MTLGAFLAGSVNRGPVLEPVIPFPTITPTPILREPLQKVAATLVEGARDLGVGAAVLPDPLEIDEYIRLGRLIGEPYDERANEVQPFVSRAVVLNLTARSHASVPTAMQPFSQAPLTLHTESSGAPLERQPRYICLMCLEPGDPDTAQTIAVSMDPVNAELDARARATLRAVSYAPPGSPFLLRGTERRPVFAFRDFGEEPVRWRSHAEAETHVVNTALAELTGAMYAAPVQAVSWRRGMIVLLDNHRVFHGRTAGRSTNTSDQRHLQRLRLLPRQ